MYWDRVEKSLAGEPVELPSLGRDVRRDVRIKIAITWRGPFRSSGDIRNHGADWATSSDVLYLVAGIDARERDNIRRNETVRFVGCRKADNAESAIDHFADLKPESA